MSQSIKITNLGPHDIVVNEWLQQTAMGEGHNTKRHDLCPNESVVAAVSGWQCGVTVMEMAAHEGPHTHRVIAPEMESGWVIEHGASEVSRPRYWGGVHGWTYDNLQAIRFAREEDARSQAEVMDDRAPDNYRIAEHGWS